ncbi:ImmA/IrrE family metallo-endopeptidase [Xylocopilactobacillus apicola]|uniref:DNA-binding protein n=1 Tax=Xylocopilactobacillus apicola TaxID=2932184 RepID=A0AAU9CUE6_9LACO|nr:ImmA/IrrE family metallo-endopeptidase [Xylocopilactobacillus apicola]BDR57622.1 DNA-binding protein [Xylocopilactobacillus apicola]
MVERLKINTDVLSYYVENSGIPKEILQTKTQNLDSFLDGSKKPTFNQLSELAKVINVPTGLLLLQHSMEITPRRLKFRTLNSESLDGLSNELRNTVSEMQLKQDFLKGEIDTNLDFIGKFSIEDDYLEVVKDIRARLSIPINYQKEIGQNPLKYFRTKINQMGVFAFFNGKIKDNTHLNLDLNEFRGFVLSDKRAPIIFINQKDSKSGQLFTLIHELVHLFIGDDEIFNLLETELYTFDQTEAFVNKVAAEILMPKSEILKTDSKIETLYKLFPVSKFVIVRRLLDLGKISKTEYEEIIVELEDYFKSLPKAKKVKGGGNYLNNLNFRMDKMFFHYVENAVKQNRISYTDAFNIVGVGYKGYKTLILSILNV